MKAWIMAVVCCVSGFYAFAQPVGKTELTTCEDTLALLAHAMVHSERDTIRFASCHKFIPKLVEALEVENSFHYPFERLRTVSILYAPDSAFRIFTWQLDISLDERRYFGAIQMNSQELKLFPLIDRSFSISNKQEVLSNERWMGALYYNILAFEEHGQSKYLLFGYDYMDFLTKRKIIDVLSFDQDKAVFGNPVFVKNVQSGFPETSSRVILEFQADATVSLNYDPHLDMIIHDHLTVISGPSGPIVVPDGTYEGYKLNNGKWEHIEKVFHQTVEEPPREEGVLDDRKGMNIFGKSNRPQTDEGQ